MHKTLTRLSANVVHSLIQTIIYPHKGEAQPQAEGAAQVHDQLKQAVGNLVAHHLEPAVKVDHDVPPHAVVEGVGEPGPDVELGAGGGAGGQLQALPRHEAVQQPLHQRVGRTGVVRTHSLRFELVV